MCQYWWDLKASLALRNHYFLVGHTVCDVQFGNLLSLLVEHKAFLHWLAIVGNLECSNKECIGLLGIVGHPVCAEHKLNGYVVIEGHADVLSPLESASVCLCASVVVTRAVTTVAQLHVCHTRRDHKSLKVQFHWSYCKHFIMYYPRHPTHTD